MSTNRFSYKFYLMRILLVAFVTLSSTNLILANAMPLAAGSPGTLDNTFGGDGLVSTSLSNVHEEARAIAIQPDGKIVVVGGFRKTGNNDFFVARYEDNGSLDNSFDFDGIAEADLELDDVAHAVVLQEDGRILVAGQTASDDTDSKFAMARFNDDGSPDSSFGIGGK